MEEGGDDARGDCAQIDFSPAEPEVEEGVADTAIRSWLSAYRVCPSAGIVARYGCGQPNHGRGIFGFHQMPDESISPSDRRARTMHLFCRYRGAHSVLV